MQLPYSNLTEETLDMYTMPQMSKMLENMSMRRIAEETGISIYNLRQIKKMDGNAPWKAIEGLSKHFEKILGDE